MDGLKMPILPDFSINSKIMDEETLKSIAEQLRKPAGEYAVKVGEKMNEGNLHINLYTIEALNLAPDDNVLEIGMGNGFFVKDILSANNFIRYTGCDFSEVMVDEASKINEEYVKEGTAKFCVANAEQLPFNDGEFDRVFTVNTIYFWANPSLVLSEIKRVLKPAGQVVISIRPKSVMQYYPFVNTVLKCLTKRN
jgi:ubiquinone/menaquinone biosynthesis C-methylase UbiE